MKIPKILLTLLFFGLFCVLPISKVHAATVPNSYVTIVNPVRGDEFWNLKDQQPITGVQNSYNIISQDGLSATWLLRFDALNDPAIVSLVKQMDPNQEAGLFLEVTPTLAQAAGVQYHQSSSWHDAASVFLTGYNVQDRYKLIDTLVSKYREVFGKNPKSVGAWWIDATSLAYLKQKYQVTTVMIVADQYSTDNYQIWGQWWSEPYFPSTDNTLMPAETNDKNQAVAIIQWANRDPYNGYGSSVFDSTYSVQANDYVQYHNLGVDYFKKLLDIFLNRPINQLGQVTVGLENDFSWAKFGGEYKNQLDYITQLAKNGQTNDVTMADFASQLQSQNAKNNPNYIWAKNPLGGTGQVVWYMSPYYRVGWFYTDKGSVIRDMRLYFDSNPEPCLKTACTSLNFAYTDSKALDDVTFGNSWTIDSGQISDITVTQVQDGVQILYKNKVGVTRQIKFTPHDVAVDGKSQAASEAILNAVLASQQMNTQIHATSTPAKFPIVRLAEGLAIFLVFVLFLLYLPGFTTLRYFAPDVDGPFVFAIATAIGIAEFTVLGYIFGLLHLELIAAGIMVLAGIYGLVRYNCQLLSFLRKRESAFAESQVPDRVGDDKISVAGDRLGAKLSALGVILLGTIFVSLSVIKNGLPFSYGLGFWGPNGHDAIWHLSVIEALTKGVPPQNFAFAGTRLTNYHYFFDLFVAEIANFTHISVLDLLFRFVPVLLAFLFGCLVYALVKKISNDTRAGFIAVFFAYFGSSFGWILTYIQAKQFGGETTFWANQAGSLLLNPPFAISIVLLLTGLVLVHHWIATRSKKSWIPIIVVLGAIVEFKVYAALVLLGGLGYISVIDLVRNKKWDLAAFSIILVLTNAILFLANTTNSQGLLILSPFWIVNSMIEAPDRLNWQRLALARDSGSKFKFLAAEIIGLFAFIFGNLGTRLVGITAIFGKSKSLLSVSSFSVLTVGSLAGLLFPLLFIQKTTSWNSIQTFYYTLVFFAIFASLALAHYYERSKIIGLVLITFFVVMTLPGDLFVLQTYLPNQAPARLSFAEADALNFLKSQPQGTVLTYPFSDQDNVKFAAPVPLFAYTTTAYVSGFSGHPSYYEDAINNEIIGVDDSQRIVGQQEIFKDQDPTFIKNFFTQNNIKYIYLPKYYKENLDEGTYGVKNIFSNREVNIYQVM